MNDLTMKILSLKDLAYAAHTESENCLHNINLIIEKLENLLWSLKPPEVGDIYQDRAGDFNLIIKINNDKDYPISSINNSWTLEGKQYKGESSNYDLVKFIAHVDLSEET